MKYSVYLAWSVVKWVHDKNKQISWREEFLKAVNQLNINKIVDEILFLDPNTVTYWDEIPTEIFFWRDVYMIKLSDALVIDASNKLWLWTAQEFLIAKYYNIPVIAIAPKNSYYNKEIEKENGQVFHYIHPFLSSSSDLIVDTIEEAAKTYLAHISWVKIINPKSIDVIETSRKDYEANYKKYDKYMLDIINEICE